jgi:hypothetical protein
MRPYISPGNTKTGNIPSISLPPLKTCPLDAPCRKKGKCYGRKLCNLRPALTKTLKDNLEYYRTDPDNYFNKITSYLGYANTRFFRWHVFGDSPDQEYFSRVKYTANNTPNIKHLIFTKRFSWYPENFKWIPENLSVVFSMWNNYGDPEIPLPKSWYLDPKDPDPRIPASALDCPGNCETCGSCWHLKQLKKDVILHRH